MSKYYKLWEYLKRDKRNSVRLDFSDIEKLVGFKLSRRFIFDKLEAVYYDYEVIDYSHREQYVIFQKIDKNKKCEEDSFVSINTMRLM